MVAAMMLAGEQGIVAEQFAGDFTTSLGDRDEDTIEAPRVLALAYMPPRRTDGYLVTHGYHNRFFKSRARLRVQRRRPGPCGCRRGRTKRPPRRGRH